MAITETDIIVGMSCLGAACLLLLISVLGLVYWNILLGRRIKNLDPFVNFKLQRPKRFVEETPIPPQDRLQNGYANPVYPKNPMGQSEKPEKRDLNPIAIRSKASFDNGNFIFGNPNQLNSVKEPHYLDQDSRFY